LHRLSPGQDNIFLNPTGIADCEYRIRLVISPQSSGHSIAAPRLFRGCRNVPPGARHSFLNVFAIYTHYNVTNLKFGVPGGFRFQDLTDNDRPFAPTNRSGGIALPK
jgi:hypothetical protein